MSAYDELLVDAAERFKGDTASHEMTVLHDNGIYRHVQFKAPGTGFYWFELVTWPGSLAIRADMGSYTFSRLTDMFEFFRGDHGINPHYWAQKLQSDSGVQEYSEERFLQLVAEASEDAAAEHPSLAEAVEAEILNNEEICYEDSARRLLDGFEFWLNPEDRYKSGKGPDFQFCDALEWDLRDYTAQFLWCCYAIQWGIGVYDSKRTALGEDAAISALNFSVRVDNTLRREGIGTVGELVKLNGHDLLDYRGFGNTSLAEVIDKLGEHGLQLQEPPCPLPELPTCALNGGER